MRERRRQMRTGRLLLCTICGTTMLCGAALLGTSLYFKEHAAPDPAPGMTATDAAAPDDGEVFPAVDWEYWRKVNPDIIGWVTIPGTSVDLPIAQARTSDSAFYLTHDIYREWNYLGCPYLDAECEKLGLDSRCAMVYGHNSADGSLFADIANYGNQRFAEEHAQILLQTPEAKRILHVSAVSLVKGSDTNNKLCFDSDAEFHAWYKDRIKSSFFRLGSLEGASRNTAEDVPDAQSVVAFCTCSYNFWPDDERTIVYATDAPDTIGANTNRTDMKASEQRSY